MQPPALPPRLVAAASAQGGPFTAAQARAAGLRDRDLDRLLRSGRVVRLRRGIYAEASSIPAGDGAKHALATRAAMLRLAGPFAASHVSSAALHGIPMLRPDYSLVHVTRDHGTPRTDAGIRYHVAALPPGQLTKVDGLVVTNPARTAVDLARSAGYVPGLVAMEAALNRGLTTLAELRETAACWTNWPGAREAGRAVAFASPYSESVGETLSRVAFDALGLPAPEQQVVFFDAAGFIARVDFWWEKFFTVGEFDGRVKYVGELAQGDTLLKEKRREDRLRQGGVEMFRFDWTEAITIAPSIRHKALAAFERGSRPGIRRTLRWVAKPRF